MTILTDYINVPIGKAEISSCDNREDIVDVDCIITAAGLSSRMGHWKMMLPYLNGTILDACIKNALEVCRRVILITGYRSDEVIERYQSMSRIQLVHNSHYSHGLFSSIQCAVEKIETDYFFISHGDMPCIAPWIFRQLWEQRGDYSLFPCYQGVDGHPVLLPHGKIAQIKKADAQSNMKTLLFSGAIRHEEINSVGIHFDIDTPLAYQQLVRISA